MNRYVRIAIACAFLSMSVMIVGQRKADAIPDPCNYIPSASMFGSLKSFVIGGGSAAAAATALETVTLSGAAGTGAAAGVLAPAAVATTAAFALGPAAAAATVVAAAIGTCAFVDWMVGSDDAIVTPAAPPRSVSFPGLPSWCTVELGDLVGTPSVEASGVNAGWLRVPGNSTSGAASDTYRSGVSIGGPNCAFDGTVGSQIQVVNVARAGQGAVELYASAFLNFLGFAGFASGQSTGARAATIYQSQLIGTAGADSLVNFGGSCGPGNYAGCLGALSTTYTRTSTGFDVQYQSGGGTNVTTPYVLPGPLSDLRDIAQGGPRDRALASFFASNSDLLLAPTGFANAVPVIVDPVLQGKTDCADSSGAVVQRSATNVGSPNGLRLPVAQCLAGELPVAFSQTIQPTAGTGPPVKVLEWTAPTSWIAPSTRPNYAPCLVRGNTCGVPAVVSGSCVWGGFTVPANLCDPQTAGGRSTQPAYPAGRTARTVGTSTQTSPYPYADPGGAPTPTTVPVTVPGTQTITGNVKIDPGDAPAPLPGGRGCRPSGWGVFNPVSWVTEPIKCALEWAFVPSQTDLDTALAGVTALSNRPPFSYVTGGAAMVTGSSFTFCEWSTCGPGDSTIMGLNVQPRGWDMLEPPDWVMTLLLFILYTVLVLAVVEFL